MINWNVSPNLVSFGNPLPLGPELIQIRYYGLMYAIGFLVGFQLIQYFCKKENRSFTKLEPLLYYLIIGMTVGARLAHCFFYEPGYYLSHPWKILMIWEGGLASHGGALGILIGMWLFSRKHKEFDFLWITDRLAIPTALTFGLIRLGNLMNSEILGRPTDVPWAFVFERVDNVARHPVQIYESLGYLIASAISLSLYFRWKAKPPAGRITAIMMILCIIVRFVAEFYKAPQADFEAALPLSMGQLLNIPFLIGALYLLRYSYRTDKTVKSEKAKK